MAVKTQGFQLSTLPRAPQIPGNVGKVDVKEIYDGTRRALESFEMARTALPSMALADTTMSEKMKQLPLQTRGILAETEAIEAQAPLKTALLAAEADPRMQEAKRQALLNRSTKAPSGDIQLAQALASAQLRLQEDPNDAQAALIVASLKPIADRKGMAPVEAQNLRAADANATRITTAAGRDATTLAGIGSREGIAGDTIASREKMAEAGNIRAENVAKITAQGRVDAARTANTNKAYQTAAEQNQQIQTALGSLALLEDKADAYLASSLGSGPVVGSAPALLARGLFGDTTGQELKAALGQEMTNAVKTVQGLGAMSNIEFGAVMEQLPKPTDVGPALVTKLEYLKAIRPWLSARSNLYMTELERGTSPVSAYQKVRAAFPVPPVAGAADFSTSPPLPLVSTPSGAVITPKTFATPAEAEAAGARGEIPPDEEITVGGKKMRWVP